MRALVTGAASGIGFAVAKLLSREGWEVIGLDRQPCPVDLPAKEWLICDLARPPDVQAVCQQLAGAGGFDALIFSAGIAGVGDPLKVLQVNFIAARRMLWALAPVVNDHGSMTLVSSGAGWRWQDRVQALRSVVEEQDDMRARNMAMELCTSAAEAYNCSKELLCAFVARNCLAEWSRGVRLNSVSPGSVDTPLIPDFTASMGNDAMTFSRQAVGRDGSAEEIADVIGFLCSPKAGWINGADIKVDGGLTGALAGGAATFPGWNDAAT